MKNLKITSIYIIVCLIVTLLLLNACQSNESTALVQSDSASIGQRLYFTPGYHLVTSYSYNTDMTTKVVYICQSDDDPKDYRVCIPKTG